MTFPVSTYVGTVGQEVELEGWVNYVQPVNSTFKNKDGTPKQRARYLINSDGNTVSAFGFLPRIQKGDKIRFTGIVKELKEFNGQDQTELSNLKLVTVLTAAQ